MNPPRVLFLDQSGALGGAELYLLDVARHYRSSSCVVLLEDGPFRRRLAAEGVDVRVVPAPKALLNVRKQSGLWEGTRAATGVAGVLWHLGRLARDFDVLFANTQKALIMGALAGLLARRPVLWNLHDMLTADHFSTLNRRLAVQCANRLTSRVIVNSEATRRAFVESGGKADQTALVYNGIAPAPFEAVSSDAHEQVRAELGVGATPVVGVFGRLASWKGQHVLLEALPQLSEDVHVVLVGEALFGGDASYKERLRRQARRLGVDDRVHFLGFRDDVPRLMQACDVVAHTSVAAEPFGRVIVEGMLAGRPVVAARAGGAREIIEHERTGLLVEPGNPQALADALRRLLEQPDLRKAFSEKGQSSARQRFSVDRMIEGINRSIAAVV